MHHIDLGAITIGKSSHPGKTEADYCVMEWVDIFNGAKPGKQTDHPKCASPVLAAFAISWNDALDDETRQRLKPYIPRLVGTSGNRKADNLRAWMATDWLARTFAPAMLRLTPSLVEHADTLAGLAPLTSAATAKKAQSSLSAARSAAYSAAYSAAHSAAYSAAHSAARSAAYSALAPTVKELQESAFALFDRMIAPQEPTR